jgi:hypothetical protein
MSTTKCTVFSVGPTDFQESIVEEPDTSLPRYEELSSRIARTGQTPLIELGAAWTTLHHALGNHPADHPLGFLAVGGSPVPALDEGELSSGRYFDPVHTGEILNAMRLVSDSELTTNLQYPLPKLAKLDVVDGVRLFDRLRGFVAEAVQARRGIVVHLFR